jgi:hypothetical protein
VGADNVNVPSATGSIGLLPVTTTVSGLAKGVPTAVFRGEEPGTMQSAKPWLSKAPKSGSLIVLERRPHWLSDRAAECAGAAIGGRLVTVNVDVPVGCFIEVSACLRSATAVPR